MTTKQLRENLPLVIEQLKNGQSVQLSYRRRLIGILHPAEPEAVVARRGSSAAIRRGLGFLTELPLSTSKHSQESIKEQIAEYRTRKYGA